MAKYNDVSKLKRILKNKAFALFTISNLVSISAANAAPPIFELPVACEMGKVCSIHKYMDHDPSPERKDYACGRLSLDGDTGTDFRTPNYVVMEEGIAVLAAADGVVRATRDGMSDISVREIGHNAIKNREAGNAVVLTHQDGWETQYSHLKRGSVTVKQGQHIKVGDVIGMIGLSGNTEFPHVEFTVRHNGRAVDPFVGEVIVQKQEDLSNNPITTYNCGAARKPLWSEKAQVQLVYQPTGVLTVGFSSVVPEAEQARHGVYDLEGVNENSDVLIFWADLFGTLKGDIQRVRITAPDGEVLVESQTVLEKNNITWFMFTGKKRTKAVWPVGRYQAYYSLSRNGNIVAERSKGILIP